MLTPNFLNFKENLPVEDPCMLKYVDYENCVCIREEATSKNANMDLCSG